MMIVKKIFDFVCFFIIVPITVFFSFDTLITSFQTHQIKTQIDLSQYKHKEFDPLEHGARIHRKETSADKIDWSQYERKKPSEDTTPKKVSGLEGLRTRPRYPEIKVISYWPTYLFLKDIFIISFIWIWLILAYRFLTRR